MQANYLKNKILLLLLSKFSLFAFILNSDFDCPRKQLIQLNLICNLGAKMVHNPPDQLQKDK